MLIIPDPAPDGALGNKKEADVLGKAHMNVNEVMADMRQHGFPISPKKFNRMVDAGMLPFVKILAVSPGGRRTQLILRRDYEQWRKTELEVIT